MPRLLQERLADAGLAASIYEDPYTFVAEYAWGTPERMAAVDAYQEAQRLLIITGICMVNGSNLLEEGIKSLIVVLV